MSQTQPLKGRLALLAISPLLVDRFGCFLRFYQIEFNTHGTSRFLGHFGKLSFCGLCVLTMIAYKSGTKIYLVSGIRPRKYPAQPYKISNLHNNPCYRLFILPLSFCKFHHNTMKIQIQILFC